MAKRTRSQTQFTLVEGEKLNRNPNQPIISAEHGYLWIGNNAPNDMFCFATLSGRKRLLKLAAAIRRAALKNE